MNIAIIQEVYTSGIAYTSGCLSQFKRDEQNIDNENPANVTKDDSTSFKYKSIFFKLLTADDNGVFKDVRIDVPLKYLSNFWRSLEMPLINCKIHLELMSV